MWILKLLVRLPFCLGMLWLNRLLMLIGFPLIAIAPIVVTAQTGRSLVEWKWGWMNWLWGNDEDGIDGWPEYDDGYIKNINWVRDTFDWSTRKRIWVWSAWRNSVNNLRYTWAGESPAYGSNPSKGDFAFLTKGVKFWLCVPITKKPPYRELWLGWRPDIGAGFKSTITSLDKVGA